MSLERIDPECRPALEALRASAGDGLSGDTLAERRAVVSAMEAQLAAATPTPTDVKIEDRTIPGPDGAPEIPIRIYRPAGATDSAPGVYYIHGGGMVVGDLDSGTLDCLRFSSRLGAVVVNVGYRLAPEHPHPAPGEDCYAGLVWMFANAESLGLDTDRIAIYGPSAGGGLAAATALRARDLGGPQVRLVMAIYPMLDHRNITPSSHQITDVGVYDRGANIESWGLYLGGQEADAYAAPVLSDNLSGYPPTYIDVGTEDLFRDEDINFASNLLAAGVPVELHVHPGAFHGSELLTPTAAVSQRQLRRRMEALREALGVARPPAAADLTSAFASALAEPEALGALLASEATWWLPPSMSAQPQLGRDAIIAFRTGVHAGVFVPDSVEIDVLTEVGTDAGFALRIRITAELQEGRPYENEHAYIVTTEDGLIVDVIEYLDAAHAVAQLQPDVDANERAQVERIASDHISVTTSIEIDAAHGLVWEVLTDFDSMPEWSSSFLGLDGDFRDGGRVTAKFRSMGMTQRFDHELKFFEDGAQFGWSDPLRAGFTDRHVYRVEPLLNGRSRLVQTDEPHGPAVRVLGKLIGRQSIAAFQTFNREVKARVELLHRTP